MLCCLLFLMNINDTVGQRYGSEEHQTACGRPYRSGRMYFPPCDINKQGFCNTPGNTYPWHAMKRFVHDNQGLMKRMYGDQRHGHVLRSELQNNLDILDSHGETFIAPKYFEYDEGTENDLFQDNDMPVEENEARLFPDSIADEALYNTKFVFSEEPVISIKLSNLQSGHRLGPIIEKTATITELINNETVDHITETADYNITTETDDEQIISTTSQILNTDDDSSEKYTEDQKISGNLNNENLETMLFQDIEAEPTKTKIPVNLNLNGVNACPVKEEIVAPFWANNTRGETLALLNMYPFEQYVHWEKCSFELRKMYCKEGCRCEQQYRLHRLLAYDPNNECRGIFSDWFRFPSCCVCKCYDVAFDFRITSRSPRGHTND